MHSKTRGFFFSLPSASPPPLTPLAWNILEPLQSLRRRRHKINMLDRENQRAPTPTTPSTVRLGQTGSGRTCALKAEMRILPKSIGLFRP